jgi:hypothetical protein
VSYSEDQDTRHKPTGYEAQSETVKKLQAFVLSIVSRETERLQILFKYLLNLRTHEKPTTRANGKTEKNAECAQGGAQASFEN